MAGLCVWKHIFYFLSVLSCVNFSISYSTALSDSQNCIKISFNLAHPLRLSLFQLAYSAHMKQNKDGNISSQNSAIITPRIANITNTVVKYKV